MPKRSCKLPSAYRGPAALIGAGIGFALVGVVPLAITLGLGVKSSATIIGVGFVGFGIMLLMPGICWCLVVKHSRTTWWRKDKQPGDENLQTPALSKDAEADRSTSYKKYREDDEEFDDIHDDQQRLHTSSVA